jgi:hypothetical protein
MTVDTDPPPRLATRSHALRPAATAQPTVGAAGQTEGINKLFLEHWHGNRWRGCPINEYLRDRYGHSK